ncbi:hypothetical protein [Desulfolucanica intricata]|uniref:hypothetical protein n=1 Tax=Desulfolucanica intricata TaxID=1285191 RepID=UPI00082F8CB1|nr:hypothetical protein [Desulfolucanica intricata]
MLIATDKMLAMRCPECGKLEYDKISRFQFSGCETVRVTCSCGVTKLIINYKKRFRSVFWLQTSCLVCETMHMHKVTGRSLWSEDAVTYLYCPETGMELGCFGSVQKVKEIMSQKDEELKVLLNEINKDDFFNNSEIMYEVINCLHDIADRGFLYCQCGNTDIELDIFPDRLELHCKNCDSINIIYAENEDDLKVIQQVEKIELVRHGFKFLDSWSNNGKNKKPRRRRK